jgi:hypothetical protein
MKCLLFFFAIWLFRGWRLGLLREGSLRLNLPFRRGLKSTVPNPVIALDCLGVSLEWL